MSAHTAVAVRGIEDEVVQAVLDDWRTAPVSDALRATLGFLEKITHSPAAITPEDLAPMREAGVSEQGIEEAMYVCFLFNIVNRLADTFDFEVASSSSFTRLGHVLYRLGYAI